MDLSKRQRQWLQRAGVDAGAYKTKDGPLGFYPEVASEDETLVQVVAGRSLARFGDGEMKLAAGGSAVAQRETSLKLRDELCQILADPSPQALVGILNIYSNTPKLVPLLTSAVTTYTKLLPNPSYVSSMVTRPDLAPWIDRPDYWSTIEELWINKEVTLVLGSMRSLRPDEMRAQGATVREVWGPRTNAYRDIDRIEEEIGKPSGPVLLCLGPTATILAYRLVKKGLWAIDLGHVGMFLRHKGSFQYKLDNIASPDYRKLLGAKHGHAWNGKGHTHIPEFVPHYRELDCVSMLDYGCGHNPTVARDCAKLDPPIRVSGFDPGVPERSGMPKPVDYVICIDVLEHVEPALLHNVVDHIFTLAEKGAYLAISCNPSKHTFPDGRNVHLIIEPPTWWLSYLAKWGGWKVERHAIGKHLRVWLRKL